MVKNVWLKIINLIMIVVFVAFWGVVSVGQIVGFVEKNYTYPLKHSEMVNEYADAYLIDRALIYSLIKVESSFNEKAQSKKGAKGLMQITDKTAEFISGKLGVKEYDLFSSRYSVWFGCYYLRYLMDKFSSLEVSLCAYNAGEGNVISWLKNPSYSKDGATLDYIPFKETREYIDKIERSYHKYVKIYKDSIYQ